MAKSPHDPDTTTPTLMVILGLAVYLVGQFMLLPRMQRLGDGYINEDIGMMGVVAVTVGVGLMIAGGYGRVRARRRR